MTALVIGASGLVGSHLLQALAREDETASGTFFGHPAPGCLPLDVRDRSAVEECFRRTRPGIVYLPASLTHVDYCETHAGESVATNVTGVRHVAAAATGSGARIVYFSSDYVFPGDGGPYREIDPVGPLSVYGTHKLLAEQSLPADALIVRTTVVYGREDQGKNFTYRLRGQLGEGREMKVPADQVGNPTYAPNLARAALALARRGARGVYHVAGPDRVSRYEFALEAARVFGLDPSLLRPVATAELNHPARRPLAGGMVVDKARDELPFPLIGYREGLRLLREELAEESRKILRDPA